MEKSITIKAALILLSMMFALNVSALQADSVRFAALDAKLAEYVTAIETAGHKVQKEECDFLIGSSSDSLMRQHIALKLYDHYLTSNVMGSEAVAIHILDRWFFSGEVQMPDDIALINARVYADFNRQSLIGERAPSLAAEAMSGRRMTLFEIPSDRYAILYFYDTDCAKCKVETTLLKGLLEKMAVPVDLYAFYAGGNRSSWEKYVSERMDIRAAGTDVIHLWDPQVDSDFQRKYGVLQTPRMFLISPDRTIIGRGLDTSALAGMLDVIFSEKKLEYGSPEAFALFDAMLETDSTTHKDVEGIADNIAVATIAKGDTLMFRQLAGDYLYYLAGKREQAFREGLSYLIDRYILSVADDVWSTADDSLKVTGFARILDDLLSKSVPGSRIAAIKVPGIIMRRGVSKEKTLNLRKLHGRDNVIIFHTEGCHICEAEIAEASSLVQSDRHVRVFLVNVDEILATDPSLASRLFDTFDLSALPYILITDRQGIICSRYETLQK